MTNTERPTWKTTLPSPALLVLGLLLATPAMGEQHWSAWRGPHGTGVAEEIKNVPTKWSNIENIAWKVRLAEPGNSTPVIWGDNIFLTGQGKGGKARTLACLNRADGEARWNVAIPFEGEDKTHKTNPYGSASAATNGEVVVAWFGSAGLYCYDTAGKQLWKRDTGAFDHIWGYGTSPVIHEDTVILHAGPGIRTFLAAYNLSDGETIWQRELPDATSKNFKEFRGSWGTPVLYNQGGQTLMAISTPKRLQAINPADGKTVWSCEGLSLLSYTSPLIGKEAIVAMSGYHGPALAVRHGGKGDITETHRLWLTTEKNPQRVGSGVLVDGHVYILNENGVAWCIDVMTGKRQWEKRLGGTAWPSASYVDGRIYAMNQDGTTFVLKANPEECELLEKNNIDELTRASHAFADGQVFIRTYEHLWCFEEE